jgi:signal peptidase I
MQDDTTAASPQPRTYRAGWGWLLLSALSRFYLVLVGALAACAVLPMLFGLSGAVVRSGSMEPHIHAGDVVLSRALSPEAPTPLGRVVTFPAPPGSAYHGDVLHRLVAINADSTLTTKGDANVRPDSAPLARRDIISTACLLIPWVGLPFFWVSTGTFWSLGLWVLLTVVALIVGAVDAAERPPEPRVPPEDPGPPTDSGQDPENRAEDATPTAAATTGKQGGSIPSVVNRYRHARWPHLGVTAAMLSIAALAITPLGTAGAAFSATTGAAGSSWSTSGPATHLAFTSSPASSTGGVPFSTQPAVAVLDESGATVGVSSAPVTLHIVTPAGASLSCTSNPSQASAGIASFAGCRIDKVGIYTLTATSGTLTAAFSTSFTISTGPADNLDFTTSPSGSSSGVAFATQPVVSVRDAGGNTVTSSTASVTLSITPPTGGASLTCTANPKSAASGVAAFAGCSIGDPGTYTLTAVSGGLTTAVSAGFTIDALTATKLAFTTSPSGSTGGTAFATQPAVTVQDASGATVTTSSASVTLSITTPAGASLTCTDNPKSAASGVATFAGCRVNKTGTYTLTAASAGLTSAVSASFTITVGPATQLGFTQAPANTAANTAFAAQPKVAIQDAGGNTRTASTASITLTITTPAGGAALTNCSTNPLSTTLGVASFANCRINNPGTYTLTATAGGLTAAVSTTFAVYGPATSLDVTTDPSDGTGGTALALQPVVTVLDAGGRTVGSSTVAVTLSITAPAGGAVLTCTTNPRAAVAGVSNFAGCKVNKAGTYTLTAASSGLTSAVSTSFTITVGPATKLAFTTSPSSSTGGTAFATQPVVTVQDAGGNTVTTSTASVDLSITTPAGATLTCTDDPRNAVSGVATFAGCRVNKTGTYTLTAASSGLTSAASASFTITVGPATQLAFTTSPSSSAVNTAFATQPRVTVQDAGGNTVTTSGPSVTLVITPPAGGAVLTCSANPRATSSGVASFSTCRINLAGTYTLTASSGTLAAAVSTSFTIT